MTSIESDSPSLIELSNVSYSIGHVAILTGITFRSDQRRIGIVGRNGSGKSTLARLLCGLMPPTTGSLTIAGVDVANDRQAAIRTVGMLFQNPDHQIIFPTVEEELVFGMQQLGCKQSDATRAANDALDRFNCEHWAGRSVSTLSQGQRHLVCLIAVLLMKPRLVILDEPYAGLDIPTTMQLKKHLHAIDASIVHISHQPDMLQDYDQVVWVDDGEIADEGPPTPILHAFNERMKHLGRSDALV